MKIRLFALFALIFVNVQITLAQTSGWVTLKGQLKNFSNQVDVEDMSEFQYLLPPTSDRLIIPDEKGNFSIKFKLAAPNYFRLGRNTMYLTPGDDLTVFIDKSNPNLATFEGKGAEANLYMKQTPFPKGGSYLEAGRNLKDTPAETISILQTLAAKRSAELSTIKGVSNEFISLEKGRIKADLINSLQSGITYSSSRFRNNKEQGEKFLTEYRTAIAPLVLDYQKDFTRPDLMKIVVYRDIADGIIANQKNGVGTQVIKDYYLAYRLVSAMQKVSDKSVLKTYTKNIDSIQTTAYKLAARQTLDQLAKFGKGDIAKDFTAVDASGKPINLTSLKGKVIYVDLWATWCGPCMAEMPHFEILKAKYKDNPNVAFVSLSIDDSSELWKKSIAERKADGYQWMINRSKLKDYNIVGIPRILLIDKTFKVADMNAMSPSSSKVTAIIDELIAK